MWLRKLKFLPLTQQVEKDKNVIFSFTKITLSNIFFKFLSIALYIQARNFFKNSSMLVLKLENNFARPVNIYLEKYIGCPSSRLNAY